MLDVTLLVYSSQARPNFLQYKQNFNVVKPHLALIRGLSLTKRVGEGQMCVFYSISIR